MIDKELYDPELERAMRRVNYLRRNSEEWINEWNEISIQVYEKSKQATEMLVYYGVEKAYIHDGHIKEIHISVDNFLEFGKALQIEIPQLQFLTITDKNKAGYDLFNFHLLSSIKCLRLRHTNLTDGNIGTFAKSPYVQNICWLDLGDNQKLTDKSLFYIAESINTKNICFIATDGTHLSDFYDPFESIDGLICSKITGFGKELESSSPRKKLPWVNAIRMFDEQYPPRMSDAVYFQNQIIDSLLFEDLC